MISKRKSNPFCHTYMPTDRRTVLRRAGVQICVRDNRHNYQRQRDVVGYDAVVSDADKRRAREAMKRHKEKLHYPPRNGFMCRCVVIDFNRKPMKWGEVRSTRCDNERW